MQNSDINNAAIAALASVWLVIVLIGLAFFILHLIINWRIAEKAGYSGPLSLLMLIPVVNYVILLIFAFGEWPIETRLKGLTEGVASSLGTAVVPARTS